MRITLVTPSLIGLVLLTGCSGPVAIGQGPAHVQVRPAGGGFSVPRTVAREASDQARHIAHFQARAYNRDGRWLGPIDLPRSGGGEEGLYYSQSRITEGKRIDYYSFDKATVTIAYFEDGRCIVGYPHGIQDRREMLRFDWEEVRLPDSEIEFVSAWRLGL